MLQDLSPRKDPKGGSPYSGGGPRQKTPLPITLREFNEAVTLKEYVDVKFQSMGEGIDIAKKELDRRLEDLNKLREEVIRDRVQFVRQELYDRLRDEVGDIRSEIVKMQTGDATSEKHKQSSNTTKFAVLGVAATSLQIMSGFILYLLLHK